MTSIIWLAIFVGCFACLYVAFRLQSRSYHQEAQFLTILVLFIPFVYIALLGLDSDLATPNLRIPPDAERIFIALAAGLLAQIIVLLDRVQRHHIATSIVSIMASGLGGAASGLAFSMTLIFKYPVFEEIPKEIIALVGFAGGFAGVAIFDRINPFGGNGHSND